jgi:ABC-type transporter Mla subunit MlaD
MAEPRAVLLQEVRAKRERAEQVRRVARSLSDEQVAQRLEAYAVELDRLAADLERQTALLKDQRDQTSDLAGEINSQMTEASARLDDILREIKRSDGEADEG